MKSIFIRILNLVRTPQEEWNAIVTDSPDVDSVRRSFFFPFLKFVTGAILFICILKFTWTGSSFPQFLGYSAIQFFVVFSSLFAGVYGSVLILNQLLAIRYFSGVEKNFYKCFSLVVYPSSILWIITLLRMMIDALFFIEILDLYVAYVIWCGLTTVYPKLEDNKKGVLSIVILVLLFVCPTLVEKLLIHLMN